MRTSGHDVLGRARHSVRADVPALAAGAHGVTRPTLAIWLGLMVAGSSFAATQSADTLIATNATTATESTPRPVEVSSPSSPNSRGMEDSAFRIVAERNIFNANRSGGQVRLSSSQRPARVESFTLVGTMAYEKGAYAFFAGSSSEFSKVIKTTGVIAGHKVVDVLANSVKLEADGKITDLPIGSAMRREDEGAWKLGDAVAGSGASYASTREDDRSSRSGRDSGGRFSRSSRAESASEAAAISSNSSADQSDSRKQDKQDNKDLKKELKLDSKMESEILKRLMERREKESQ